MDEKIFDRIEKKYLIDSRQKKSVLSEVKKHMHEDQYFKSEVINLYFDTDNFDLIIKSIENPDFKEKLRARSYGGYDKVFLEIKTKMKEKDYRVGYKRRFLITHEDFKKLATREKTAVELAGELIEKGNDIQIAREVDYMINYFNLKPQILVYYDRRSYLGENNLRITFDENLKYRDTDLNFNRRVGDKNYFDSEKNIIMEVKAHEVMPLWLVQTFSANKIYPVRFSKIGKIYEKIRKEK